jgi:molecular chaperone GrpE
MHDPDADPTTAAIEDIHDKYLRALANLDNLQKRTRKDVELARDQAEAEVILAFLPLIDDFRRALEADADPALTREQARQGYELVFRKFGSILENLEVKGFEAIGQRFTGELMEAITQVPTRALPAGTVVGQIEQGFTRRGKLLRAAKVAVAKEDGDDEPGAA